MRASDNSIKGKIIIRGTQIEKNEILYLINSLSEKQYKLSESQLVVDSERINIYGSSLYSASVDRLLLQGMTTIRIDNFYENEYGVDVKLPNDIYGNIQAGYTYGSTEAQVMNITITNKSADIYPTSNDYANIATPAEILMHEIAGHAVPRMVNQQNNAIEIENQIRLEISNKVSGHIYGFKYLLRKQSNHPSIP